MNRRILSLKNWLGLNGFQKCQGLKTRLTHYETLEIPPNASAADIKAAYYKLSKLYHPDINKSEAASQRFQDLSTAYEILGNLEQRQIYDSSRFRGRSKPEQRMRTESTGQPTSFKSSSYEARKELYDFDQFYKNHYGRTLHERKANYEFHKMYVANEHMIRKRKKLSTSLMFFLFVMVFFSTYSFIFYQTPDHALASKSSQNLKKKDNS